MQSGIVSNTWSIQPSAACPSSSQQVPSGQITFFKYITTELFASLFVQNVALAVTPLDGI